MSKPLLIYFDGRGRSEIIRLLLAAADVQFDETDLKSREQFQTLIDDGTLMFGQTPYLKYEGREIVQAGAICRFLAKKHGMMGKTLEEETLIDQLFEGTRDFVGKFLGVGFMADVQTVKEDAEKTLLPKYLPIYEKVLGKNSCGYLVGDRFSLADAGLFEVLLAAEEYCDINSWNDYPNIKKFMETVNGLSTIESYKKDVRKPQNTPEYVTDVCQVLGWPLTPKF